MPACERKQKASARILRSSRRLPSRQAIPAGRLSEAGSCSSSGAAFARRELAAGSSLPRWRRKRESGRATCRPSRRSASSSSRAQSTPRGSFAPTPTTSASTASFSSTSTTLASAPTRLLQHRPSSSYELGLCGRTALSPQSSSSRLPARCLRGNWAGRRRGPPARAQPRRQRPEPLPRPPRARRDRPAPRQPTDETGRRSPRTPRHPRALLALGPRAERAGKTRLRGYARAGRLASLRGRTALDPHRRALEPRGEPCRTPALAPAESRKRGCDS
jgi:hypothetical protein